MKKFNILLILLAFLLVGCSSPMSVPISEISESEISLFSPISVSFELPANTDLKIPFNLSITKTAIRVNFEGEDLTELTLTLYRADNDIDVAVATVSEKSSAVTFTNLRSNYDYYLVVTNETSEISSLILELSERMS